MESVKEIKNSNTPSRDSVKTIKTAGGEEFTYKKKKGGMSLAEKRTMSGWLFILPFVLGIVLIYAPILITSLRESFSSISTSGEYTFVGFANYKYIFTDHPWFSISIWDAMKDLILQIPAIVIFSLFMAVILNQKMTGRAVFRAIFFIPVILSTGIIDTISRNFESMENMAAQGGIDNNTGAEESGLVSALDIEMLLGNIKLGSGIVTFVTNLVNGIFDIVSRSGVQMLIFLSALQSISPSIYEACEIEGASAWEIFWKVTLPMVSPMIFVNAIYTIIDAFTRSDNRVMQLMADARSGKEIPPHLSGAGVASAEAWIYLIFVTALILLVVGAYLIFRKLVSNKRG